MGYGSVRSIREIRLARSSGSMNRADEAAAIREPGISSNVERRRGMNLLQAPIDLTSVFDRFKFSRVSSSDAISVSCTIRSSLSFNRT